MKKIDDAFVYYIRPKVLRGNYIVPLNVLRSEHPDLFQENYQKYVGREHLAKVWLPILNCLWNDVVHLSPIHPSQIRKALTKSDPNPILDRKWLKIPVSALMGAQAIYFESKPVPIGGSYDFSTECFRQFSIEKFQELEELPEWTLQYYRSEIAENRRPLLFNGVPHVLVKGKISLARVEEISW